MILIAYSLNFQFISDTQVVVQLDLRHKTCNKHGRTKETLSERRKNDMSEIETGHPEGGESNIGHKQEADTPIHERVEACLNGLNKLFAPPFNEEVGDDLVSAIRDQARCEAVSIFLSKQDPRRLDCLAGTGYDDSYSGLKCYLSDDKQYLTAYVFKNRRPVSGTYAEIAQDLKDYLPSVVEHAEFHLKKGPARNIIAMPIMSGAGRCYGVLNLENKEEELAENGRFRDADFSFASVVANLLGVAFQQRLYGKLVIDPPYEPRQKSPFSTQLEAIAQMLKLHVRAECVSIFVRKKDAQGKWILAYEAGVGYIQGYDLVYQWDDKNVLYGACCAWERTAPVYRCGAGNEKEQRSGIPVYQSMHQVDSFGNVSEHSGNPNLRRRRAARCSKARKQTTRGRDLQCLRCQLL